VAGGVLVEAAQDLGLVEHAVGAQLGRGEYLADGDGGLAPPESEIPADAVPAGSSAMPS